MHRRSRRRQPGRARRRPRRPPRAPRRPTPGARAPRAGRSGASRAPRFLSWRIAASTAPGSSPGARAGRPCALEHAARCAAASAAGSPAWRTESRSAAASPTATDSPCVSPPQPGRGLDAVADRVAEVEDRAAALLGRVPGHDERLEAGAAGARAARIVARPSRRPGRTSAPAGQQRGLDDLGHARPPLARGQRREQLRVARAWPRAGGTRRRRSWPPR